MPRTKITNPKIADLNVIGEALHHACLSKDSEIIAGHLQDTVGQLHHNAVCTTLLRVSYKGLCNLVHQQLQSLRTGSGVICSDGNQSVALIALQQIDFFYSHQANRRSFDCTPLELINLQLVALGFPALSDKSMFGSLVNHHESSQAFLQFKALIDCYHAAQEYPLLHQETITEIKGALDLLLDSKTLMLAKPQTHVSASDRHFALGFLNRVFLPVFKVDIGTLRQAHYQRYQQALKPSTSTTNGRYRFMPAPMTTGAGASTTAETTAAFEDKNELTSAVDAPIHDESAVRHPSCWDL